MKPRPKQFVTKKAAGSKPSSAESGASRPVSTTPTGSARDSAAPVAAGELGSIVTLQMLVGDETVLVRWKVVYSGPVYFADGRYLGLVQTEPANTITDPQQSLWLGDTDGTVDGMQYFTCPSPAHGLMLSYELWLAQQPIAVHSRPSSAKSLREGSPGIDAGAPIRGGVGSLLHMRRHSSSLQGPKTHTLARTSDSSTQTSPADTPSSCIFASCQTDPMPLVPLEVQTSVDALLGHFSRVADFVCSRVTSSVERDDTVVQTAAAAHELLAALSEVPNLFAAITDLEVDSIGAVTHVKRLLLPAAQEAPDGGSGLFAQLLKQQRTNNSNAIHRESAVHRHSSFISTAVTKLCSADSAALVAAKNPRGDTGDGSDTGEALFFFSATSPDVLSQFPGAVREFVHQLRSEALQRYVHRVCANVFNPILEYLTANARISDAALSQSAETAANELPTDVHKYVETRVHTEEKIRRLLFSIDELTRQIEVEAAEGNVDALEALTTQKVELAQKAQQASSDLLDIFEPIRREYCEGPMQLFKGLAKRTADYVTGELAKACRDESRAVDAKLDELERSVQLLQDKMVRDNFRLNKDLGDVCGKYADNMQRQLDLTAEISSLIKQLIGVEQEGRRLSSEMAAVFVRKEETVRSNCAAGALRCVERSALAEVRHVRRWAEDHCAALRHQLACLEEDEVAALMAVQRTLFEHQTAAHDLHLECYRQVCLCSGELQWKKEQALKAIEGRLLRATAELEIALDSLSPDAKQIAQVRNALEETRTAMGRQVLQICASTGASEELFMERTGRPLQLQGRSFKDPKEEVRLLIESKTNRLKMITEAAPEPE